MSTITRRAILRGSPVAAVAAAVSAAAVISAIPSSAATSDRLAELIQLHRDTENRYCEAQGLADEAWFAIAAALPPPPTDYGRPYTEESVNAHWDFAIKHKTISPLEAGEEWRALELGRVREWAALERKLEKEHRGHELDEQADALKLECDQIVGRIIVYPADTLAALLLKLRFIDEFDSITERAAEPDQLLVGVRVLASVLRDAERLAQKGGAA